MLRRKRVTIEIQVERFNANSQLNDNELCTRAGLEKEEKHFLRLEQLDQWEGTGGQVAST